MTKVKQKKFEESKMRSKEENINLSNIEKTFQYKNFEGKNKPNKEILDYSNYQNWFIKSELARANKNDFYNNKKLFEENLKKINMFN